MLQEPSSEHWHPYLSAASGLVNRGSALYVVADDEQHLGIFPQHENGKGQLLRLFPGDLAHDHEERKAGKPDLETLAYIPASSMYPFGALLALGSGSKNKRKRGAIIRFEESGKLSSDIDVIDLHYLYSCLKKLIGKLNIEGAAIIRDNIFLFQRGNKKNNINCMAKLGLQDFYQAIFSTDKPTLNYVITHYDLGDINGIPLCFTDAAPLPNGDIVFSAAAEDTADAYLDGKCVGSALGVIDVQGELRHLIIVNETIKIEGVAAELIDGKLTLLLVTDADDASAPAHFYSAVFSDYVVDSQC